MRTKDDHHLHISYAWARPYFSHRASTGQNTTVLISFCGVMNRLYKTSSITASFNDDYHVLIIYEIGYLRQ
jgi:hypothetical protein